MQLARPSAGVSAAAARRPAAAPALRLRRRPAVRVRAADEERGGRPVRKDVTDVGSAAEIKLKAEPAFEASPLLPAFTRRREIWNGRIAMVGFAAACIWEIITPSHVGPIGITAALSGLSVPTVKLIFAGLVGHGVLGLLWPGSPTFDSNNTRDYMRRPDGPPSMAVNPIIQPAKFFGCSPHFGFTKRNELLHGRLAMLGFAAALVNELQTGLGPIGQVAWWMGNSNPGDEWYRTAAMGLAGFALLMAGAAFASGHGGKMQGEEDIY